jgi:hypothetical protein
MPVKYKVSRETTKELRFFTLLLNSSAKGCSPGAYTMLFLEVLPLEGSFFRQVKGGHSTAASS